ncbi:hypothetical protein HDU93_002394 [Gonapodya sp. JEL0774]|nr:hypothetical protein HDU93_002394 [Gonapodya sp. JEL0774]
MEASFEAAAHAAGLKSLRELDLADAPSAGPQPASTLIPYQKRIVVPQTDSGHAINAMVRAIREGKGRTGLVHGNGEFVTVRIQPSSKHHVLILGRDPRPADSLYPDQNPLPELFPPPLTVPEVVERCPREGAWCVVETFTFEYDRANRPTLGFVVGRLLARREDSYSNKRFLANVDTTKEPATVAVMTSFHVEAVGLKGWVWADVTGRNWFRLAHPEKL